MIEPSKQYYNLVKNRRCHTSNACLSNYSGQQVKFVEEDSHDPSYNLYSGIAAYATFYNPRGRAVWKTTSSLADELDRIEAPSFIDYLSVDRKAANSSSCRLFLSTAMLLGPSH